MSMGVRFSRLLSSNNHTEVGNEVNRILKVWIGPLLALIGGVGMVYMIVLGIQYAKSESDSKRAEAKTRIINCLIGVLSILILAAVCIGLDWGGIVKIFGYASEDFQG